MFPAGKYPHLRGLARRAAWLKQAGLWSGPAYSWPAALPAPMLFSDTPAPPDPIREKVSSLVKRGQGRVVCSQQAVGIFGFRSCYYVPYPRWKQLRNRFAFWLDMHRGVLMPSRLTEKLLGRWYAHRILKRLTRLKQARTGTTARQKTTSHFLLDRKGQQHEERE